MRVLILGGDGFCGWPTSLHLSQRGHDVTIVDNFARRNADIELEASSLTPIETLGTRLTTWRELTGREIGFHRLDVAEDYRELLDVLSDLRPDAVVHFAEQRAAPYSMKSSLAQALHGQQQPERHEQPLGRDRGVGARLARRPPRDDGRLRLRRRGREDPGGLSPREDRDRRRGPRRAGDPFPAQPGQHLPHDEDAGSAPLRLLQQERRGSSYRPAPGHRLGNADGGDAPRRAADQPLRLRRRLRDRPQPLRHAGGDRLPAHRARHGRADACVHPSPGQRPLHPARRREPAAGAASGCGSSTR